MRVQFSLIDIFGKLPVSPHQFKTLDPNLKWLGVCSEGDSWCVSCGTLEPNNPRAHHPECCSFKDADSYSYPPNKLGICPQCKSEDGLMIESSREMQLSTIHCIDCCYEYTGSVPEETLIKRFFALVKLRQKAQEASGD